MFDSILELSIFMLEFSIFILELLILEFDSIFELSIFVLEFIEPEFVFELIEPEFVFELIEPEFVFELIEPEFIFEFIVVLVFFVALELLFDVSVVQAAPIAPKANTAERAKVFFILKSYSYLLNNYLLLDSAAFLSAVVPQTIYFQNIGQYKSLNSDSQTKTARKLNFLKSFLQTISSSFVELF